MFSYKVSPKKCSKISSLKITNSQRIKLDINDWSFDIINSKPMSHLWRLSFSRTEEKKCELHQDHGLTRQILREILAS